MERQIKDKLKAGFVIFVIVGLFILVSFLVQNNLEPAKNLIEGYKSVGVLVYILVVILAIVLAPVSAIPLLPVASNLFGWINAAIYSIIGWFFGSMLAFYIARKYGKPLVKKLISLKAIEKIEDRIPRENKFFSLIFLRMTVPVDILSYALGLFTKIDWKIYLLTTLTGIIPFAFVFSYFGTLPVVFQITGFLIGFLILIIGWYIAAKRFK